jgi:hypothetical protein
MDEPIRCFFIEPTGDERQFTIGTGRLKWSPIYRRTDTGKIVGTLSEVPIGAMWYADWYPDDFCNPQLGSGKALVVKTPGGDWLVDQQASNCTMPDDVHQKEHHCWIIHGTPPNITVNKNGATCKAGGGSIAQANWHGFLRDGYLVKA